jgi:AraC family transcriptional regulator
MPLVKLTARENGLLVYGRNIAATFAFLEDAERRCRLDGAAGSGLCDLRDRMTFIPAGGSISGWSAPKKRANSFTALYFDPDELTCELAGAFSKVELCPLLYFLKT